MVEKEKDKPKKPEAVENTVRDIRRVTRKKYTAEDKIRIVLEGLRGETGIRELCRREGIATNLDYTWPKEILEAGRMGQLNGLAVVAKSKIAEQIDLEKPIH